MMRADHRRLLFTISVDKNAAYPEAFVTSQNEKVLPHESALMSLWKVDDQTTKALIVAYYKWLLKGEGRGEALRRVQLQMLRSEDQSHPYFWASFIQSGDWRNLEGKETT